MTFSIEELSKVDQLMDGFCRKRNHPDYIDQVRLDFSVHDQVVEIYEERPYWRNPSEKTQTPVARIRYVRSQDTWKLYWMRSNLKWQLYEPFPGGRHLREILNEIDRDTFGCFFG